MKNPVDMMQPICEKCKRVAPIDEEHAAACPDRIIGCCGQSARMDLCAIGHMADWLIANGVSFVTDNCPNCGADMRRRENDGD